jgi:Sec-independent protein secretion pathway component TatC
MKTMTRLGKVITSRTDGVNQRFSRYLQILPRPLLWVSPLVLGGILLGYLLQNGVLSAITALLHGGMYISQPTGTALYTMQATLLGAVVISIPAAVYGLISAVRPILPWPVTTRQIAKLIAGSYILTAASVIFAYCVSLPATLQLLQTTNIQQLHTLVATSSYVSFAMGYIAVTAIVMQLPLLLLLIDRGAPLNLEALGRRRKWVVIVAFGAALILPVAPDPLSQLLLALPIVVMYEASFWMVVLAHRPVRWRVLAMAFSARVKPPAKPKPAAQLPQVPAKRLRPGVIDLRKH